MNDYIQTKIYAIVILLPCGAALLDLVAGRAVLSGERVETGARGLLDTLQVAVQVLEVLALGALAARYARDFFDAEAAELFDGAVRQVFARVVGQTSALAVHGAAGTLAVQHVLAGLLQIAQVLVMHPFDVDVRARQLVGVVGVRAAPVKVAMD